MQQQGDGKKNLLRLTPTSTPMNANARDVRAALAATCNAKKKKGKQRRTRVSHRQWYTFVYTTYPLSGSGRMYRRSRTSPMGLWRIATASAVLRLVIVIIMIIIIEKKGKKGWGGKLLQSLLLS
jgi:hypothetical protein